MCKLPIFSVFMSTIARMSSVYFESPLNIVVLRHRLLDGDT